MSESTTCIIDGCDKVKGGARGMCPMHYQRQRIHGSLDKPVTVRRIKPDVPCKVSGCESIARKGRQGMCNLHAARAYKYGDPNYVTPNPRRNGVEPCSVDGCEKVSKAYLMCVTHATRFGRHGDPSVKGKTRLCDICDAPFVKFGRQRCCSVDCRKELVALNGYVARRRSLEKEATVERFTRTEIFERDGWICQLCNEPVDRNARARASKSASLDHIYPLILGGEHSRANTQCAHFGCNARKRDRVDTATT